MKKSILSIICLLSVNSAFADINSCTNLYVGKIESKKGIGLERFTMVEQPTALVGSNWIYVTSWNQEDKKSVLSLLLSAKMGSKKLSINTDSGCGITSVQQLSSVVLQSGQ